MAENENNKPSRIDQLALTDIGVVAVRLDEISLALQVMQGDAERQVAALARLIAVVNQMSRDLQEP